MTQKEQHSANSSAIVVEPPGVVDRRDEFLVGLLSSTDDDVHIRIVKAYRAGRTVEAAESELQKIIDEIIHEDERDHHPRLPRL